MDNKSNHLDLFERKWTESTGDHSNTFLIDHVTKGLVPSHEYQLLYLDDAWWRIYIEGNIYIRVIEAIIEQLQEESPTDLPSIFGTQEQIPTQFEYTLKN